MAQKINMKVAIIGIVILAFFVLGIVFVYMHYNKNPHKLLAEAETLLETALAETEVVVSNNYSEEEIEEEIEKVKKIYAEALGNYGGALGAAKDPEFQIELLFTLADYHKIDNLVHPVAWDKVAACWNRILTVDSKNIEANKALLDYTLETASSMEDAGVPPNANLWKRIRGYAIDLITAMEEQGHEPEIYVRIAKARSALIIAQAGQTTNKGKSANEAMAELQAVKELDPKNVEIYKYLAEAAWLKAEADQEIGDVAAVEKALKNQMDLLQQAVDVAPDSVKAHTTLLNAKLSNLIRDKKEKELELLESDYIALTKKFSEQAEAFIALGAYYFLDINNIDRSIENMHKAIALDKQNVRYARRLARAYYRKGFAYNAPAEFEKAAEILANALAFPDSLEITGAREQANKINRTTVLGMLVTNYVEIAYAADQADKKVWAEKLSDAVYQIEQYRGSQEDPQVLKWHGFIDLANGDDELAIRKLYNAYRQFRASATVVGNKYIHRELRHLPYLLARIFAEKKELGLCKQFLEDAFSNGIVQLAPQALLDYSEMFIDAGVYTNIVTIINNYKDRYPETPRANSLLVRVYPMVGEYDKAVELLSAMDPDASETMRLKIELFNRRIPRMTAALKQETSEPEQESFTQEEIDKLQKERVALLKKLLANDPENAMPPGPAAAYFVRHKQLEKAKDIMDLYIAGKKGESQGDSVLTKAKIFRAMLQEPDPLNVSVERTNEITLGVISKIADPKQKNISLASFYNTKQDMEKTYEYFNEAHKIDPDDPSVIESLFGIALQLEDQELAKIYIDIAVEKNIDLCEGKMFKARLDMFDEDYQNAIIKLTDCLKLRPTLSLIYMLRSQCYSKIDNHQEAIDDAKTATQMNPFDGNVAKNYASVIYTRNSQLGAGVTKEQRQELLPALREAIRSNPGAWQIQSMYAETVAKDDPEKALDVYQRLVKIHPNLQTYMQLGSMSLKMAMRQTVTSEKEFHLQAAEKAFQNAYAIDPSDQDLLNMYSEYYRLTGQPEKVAELFSGKKESMWKFHLRDGQNEKALKVLQEQYDNDPENTSTLIGLVTVSQRMDAKEDLIRYSEELLKIDDNLENKLLQIQMFLSMGLASETEAKLESLKKNHPDDDRVLLAEAGTTLIKGKPAQALEFLNEYIQKHPNNTNALQLRARVNGTLGDFEQVINDLQKCIQISPSPEVQYLLAQTQARLGNITFAIGILNEVLKDGRAPVKARRLLETIYRKYNKRSELFPFYDETLQKYPNSIYWKLRAGTFLSSNGRYDKAEELLLGAWELSQKQGGGINILSEYLSTLMTAKKYKQAQKFATEQINGKFAPIAYAYLGMIQIEYKEKEKAKEYFYKSLEKAENDSSFIAGILGKMLQFFDQKVVSDWCNSRLEKDPTSLPANITMFRLYQGSNDYDNALKYINKCLDSVDKNGNQWRFFSSEKATHLTVAYMKTSEKRFLQQAIVSYEDILKASPNNTDVMNNLAYLLADNNEKNEDAVNYARTAYKSRPNDTNRMDTYAYALYRIGDYKKAEELLLSAIAICQQRNTQPDWGVYKHLAMTQEALGKKSEAIKHYDQALELAGNNISAKEKEQIEKELDRLTGN